MDCNICKQNFTKKLMRTHTPEICYKGLYEN